VSLFFAGCSARLNAHLSLTRKPSARGQEQPWPHKVDPVDEKVVLLVPWSRTGRLVAPIEVAAPKSNAQRIMEL